MEIVQENKQPQPYLVAAGDINDCGQYFLEADCQVVMSLTIHPVLALLASYFVYNICYPKGCKNFYSFLEIFFVDAQRSKVPISVNNNNE